MRIVQADIIILVVMKYVELIQVQIIFNMRYLFGKV